MAARCGGGRCSEPAGIDASEQLVRIAAERTPEGDFRSGDMEALPWGDDSFDVVTGNSSFQFADDKVRALREARRVSRGTVVVAIPTRVPDSGLTAVFRSIFPLFEEDALESVKRSGMFALSEPGRLDEVLAAVPLTPYDDEEIECPIAFDDGSSAERAFLGAGATQFAIGASGEAAVAEALRTGLEPFVEAGGRVVLPTWFRVALAAAR